MIATVIMRRCSPVLFASEPECNCNPSPRASGLLKKMLRRFLNSYISLLDIIQSVLPLCLVKNILSVTCIHSYIV